MHRIFKDISKLSPTYVPQKIPHRENDFKYLLENFRPVLNGEESYTHVLIIGSPGVGKTVLTKFFQRYLLTETCASDFMHIIYVNYKIERIPGNVIRRISSLIIPAMPLRGYSLGELFIAVMEEVVREGKRILLIIDDADSIFYRDQELIYQLTRVDEILSGYNPLSLILVIHREDALSYLDPWTAGTLRKNIIRLMPYSYEQLIDILNARVEEAFIEGTVSQETIETCADISATYGFNARYAIELLLYGGKIAESLGSTEVKPEHIRLARDKVPPSFSREDIMHLSIHEKIILYSLSRMLLTTNKAFVSSGDLEREYRAICDEIRIPPVSHTWFWTSIKTLTYYGLISTRESSKGYRGRTTLIGLPSFSARYLEEILRREIFRE